MRLLSATTTTIGRHRGRIAIAIILLAWIYFLFAFGEQAWRANHIQAQVDEQRTAVAEMDAENESLRGELDKMTSAAYIDYVQGVARRDLGLANPGETVFLVRWQGNQFALAAPEAEPNANEDRPNWRKWLDIFQEQEETSQPQ